MSCFVENYLIIVGEWIVRDKRNGRFVRKFKVVLGRFFGDFDLCGCCGIREK